FSKTINPSLIQDKNWVELKDLRGFNVLGGKEIICHYTKDEEEKIKKFIVEKDIKMVIGLPENTGLEISGDKIKVIGSGKAVLFHDGVKEELVSGSQIAKNGQL